MKALAGLSQDLERCEDCGAAFDLLQRRLRDLVPYEAMVIYLRHGDSLTPEYLDGDDYRLFASLEIPLGMGLSGWVAENGKAIVNGNPSVEPGYLNDTTKFSTLRSALAVPLQTPSRVAGVLSLYRHDRDAFSTEQRDLLLSLGAKLARVLEGTAMPRPA